MRSEALSEVPGTAGDSPPRDVQPDDRVGVASYASSGVLVTSGAITHRDGDPNPRSRAGPSSAPKSSASDRVGTGF